VVVVCLFVAIIERFYFLKDLGNTYENYVSLR
jgi:hypothetical protein